MSAHESVSSVAVAPSTRSEYTAREEWVHTITHGLGFLAAAVGLLFLLATTVKRGNALDVVGAVVFGSTLTLLYAASTLYHGLPESSAKQLMRKLDHIAIYLLIAGTYTPFVLSQPLGPESHGLLAVVWGLACLGVALEVVRDSATRRTSLVLYVVMGWLAVFTLGPLLETLAPTGVALLVAGGLVYSVGIIFYVWRAFPYNHAVWHAFVLAGSALHFASVMGFVVP
ncbi:MAG: hemolysin III family protein [Myxococcota bacterium]|nr:hemolysin III family protein [Myxococcota bacterium]